MLKRDVRDLIETWAALVRDVARTFPTLEDELGRDLTRLLRAVDSRGPRVLLVDLPNIAKHFDRCLAGGEYNLPGLPLTKRFSSRVVIPKFLRGLYLLVFHSSGRLKEVPNVHAIRAIRQLLRGVGKLKVPCPPGANQREIAEFAARDSCLPLPESFWEGEAAHQTDGCDGILVGESHTSGPSSQQSNGYEVDQGLRDPGYSSQRSREDIRSEKSDVPRVDLSEPADVAGCCFALEGEVSRTSRALSDLQSHRDGTSNPLFSCERGPVRVADSFEVVRRTYNGFSRSPVYQERLERLPLDKRERLSNFLAKLDRISSLVTAGLGTYNPSDWRFRHGPGAVSDYRGPSNKYCWRNWSERLEQEFPMADYGYHNHSSWARHVQTGRLPGSKEPSSRMVCVPKDFTKPRLIAAEPSEHQWCQQNVWHYFCDRTRSTWIGKFVSFNDQTNNQRLAVRGSEDGSLATIDLSNASDLVTCHAVGQLFRVNPRLLTALAASRTRFVEQNVNTRVTSTIKLRKFSTMGNACTFPVESLLFLSIAVAAVLTVRAQRVNLRTVAALEGSVSIFGDDLIVPSDSWEFVTQALELLHLQVNSNKTFGTGLFRESCGVDAFAGSHVTPVYVRTLRANGPESLASTVDTINNLYEGGWYETADLLASTLPRGIATTDMGSGVFGIRSRLGYSINGLPTRWNRNLMRHEVRMLVSSTTSVRTPIEDDSAMLQYFTEEPSPLTKWCSGYQQRPKTRVRYRWVPISDLRTKTEEDLGGSSSFELT